MDFETNDVYKYLEKLEDIIISEEVDKIDNIMRQFVSTYIKPEEANNKVYN